MYKPALRDGSKDWEDWYWSGFGLQGVQPVCAFVPNTTEMSNLTFSFGPNVIIFITYKSHLVACHSHPSILFNHPFLI